jgi:putative inorganic carbon (hco3(-)) transporter
MRYLQLQEENKLIKLGLTIGITLTALAAVGSQSRGALVGLALMGTLFWLKSRNKFATASLIIAAAAVVYQVMPQEWYQRMGTIETYDQDASAQGRINMWWMAWNLANDRIFGGGFEFWRVVAFSGYAPDPNNVRAAHSIYFQMLGDHGWIGLVLFMSLLGLTWLKCSAVMRLAKQEPDAKWARDLAAMLQVSIVAYMSAGAFLGLAYFDYIYNLVAVAVVVHALMTRPQPAGMNPITTGNETPARVATAGALPQR